MHKSHSAPVFNKRNFPSESTDLPGFEDKFAKQSSWQWNFGQTPPFTHHLDERFTWGGVEIFLDVEQGVIQQATIFSDMLDPYPMELLAQKMSRIPYDRCAIALCIEQLAQQHSEYAKELQELSAWIVTAC